LTKRPVKGTPVGPGQGKQPCSEKKKREKFSNERGGKEWSMVDPQGGGWGMRKHGKQKKKIRYLTNKFTRVQVIGGDSPVRRVCSHLEGPRWDNRKKRFFWGDLSNTNTPSKSIPGNKKL